MYTFLTQRATAYLGIGCGWSVAAHPLLEQSFQALRTVGFDPMRPLRHAEPLEFSEDDEVRSRLDASHALIVPLFLPRNRHQLDLAQQQRLVTLLELEYAQARRVRDEIRSPTTDLNTSQREGDEFRHVAVFMPRASPSLVHPGV